MYRDSTVGVVIPAYNEAGFVGQVIDTLPEFVDRAYVIDDCSTDQTWAEITRHAEVVNGAIEDVEDTTTLADGGAQFERRVVPIRHERNRGRGGAIKTGYRYAREDGIDVTAVMDGDGQMDPERLTRILDPIVSGRADYAKGTRLVHRDRSQMSNWRFFGNSLLTLLTKISSGYWRMTDPQNGYTAISREALDAIRVEDLYEDYGIENDVLTKLNVRGMRIIDVAHPAVYGDEQSGIRYSSFVPKLSVLLFRNFLWRLKMKYLVLEFHPLVLLYVVGVLGLGVGTLGSVFAVSSLVGAGSTFVRGGLSALLLVVGGISLALAMIYDLRENAHLEVGRGD